MTLSLKNNSDTILRLLRPNIIKLFERMDWNGGEVFSGTNKKNNSVYNRILLAILSAIWY
jgi:hypothetical protein